MASKSKKRRRVLGASCILAALIIAGSSFAWFTSKDEVTNRLTANSDYGVSIVESFTPPKNWLPGQEINKDVYAVNTGNIAAFVKEDVKGVLNYTYETKVNAWDEDCVELTLDQVKAIQGETTEDGFKTMEAGGYLAWTDATTTTAGTENVYVIDGTEVAASAFPSVTATATDSAGQNQKNFTNTYTVDNTTYYLENLNNGAVLYTIENERYTASTKTLTVTQGSTTSPAITPGPVYSGREQDITNPWTPTEEGTYIFRRSIGGTADNPTFTYAGYYYDGNGKYYKIVIGNDDDYRAAEDHNTTPVGYEFDVSVDSNKLGDGVTINEDGSFTGTPKIAYVKDVDVKDKQVNFKYEGASGDHGPRLVAEYAADLPTTKIDGIEYDASAMAARTEVDYYNKLGDSNKATVEYEQAKAEYDYAKALSDARDTLIDAAIARNNAYNALNGTDGAAGKYQTKWEELQSATDGAITDYGTDVRTPFVTSYLVKEDANGAPPALFSAATVARIKDTTANPDLEQARNNLEDLEELQDDIADLDAQLWTTLKPISGKGNDTPNLTPDEVNQKIATAKGLIDQLNDKIVAYKNAYSAIVDDDTITATALQLNDDTAAKKEAIQGLANALVALKDDMDVAAGAYKTAYDDYQAAVTANTKAENTWKDAIDTYNSTVGNPSAAAVEDNPDTQDVDESADAVAATGATLKYESIVKKEAPAIQPTPPASYSEANTATLVNDYSANKTGNGNTNPKIDKTDATADFATYAAMAKTPTPTTTEYSLTTKKEAMDEALAATNAAKNDYDDAVEALNSASTIKIYVNLADDYATNWTIDPADVSTAGSQDVDFYLNSILDAGETSPKLIDSVELADTTTARAYKDLTFDLNVALDSAQITYGNDQRTITTDATEGWGMTPTLTTPTDIETAVTWAANA